MEDWSDFPAAHSMDTTWFAIDRDGHVALLDSGEGGAVPDEYCHEEGIGWEQVKELAKLLGDTPQPTPGVHSSGPYGHFIMLGDANIARTFASRVEELAPGVIRCEFWMTAPPEAGFMAGVKSILGVKRKEPAFTRFHAATRCSGCLADNDWEIVNAEVAKQFGLYFYDGPAGIAEPYERVVEPEKPIEAAKLGELAEHFARFPGRFAEHVKLQPVEHWSKVGSWSASYVGTDGKVRCVPGRENDYRKEYASLCEEYDDVEPPAG